MDELAELSKHTWTCFTSTSPALTPFDRVRELVKRSRCGIMNNAIYKYSPILGK